MRDVSDTLVMPEATIDAGQPGASCAPRLLCTRFRACAWTALQLEDRYRLFAPDDPRARDHAPASPPGRRGLALSPISHARRCRAGAHVLDKPACWPASSGAARSRRWSRRPQAPEPGLRRQAAGGAGLGHADGVAPPAVDFAWFLGQNAGRIALRGMRSSTTSGDDGRAPRRAGAATVAAGRGGPLRLEAGSRGGRGVRPEASRRARAIFCGG